MPEKDKYVLTKEILDQINGGGIFSRFDDEEYYAAGVDIDDPGTFVNGGYMFHGQEISTEMATLMVYFYHDTGRQANSVEEVDTWHREHIQKYY